VYDTNAAAVQQLQQAGATGAADLDAFVAALAPPRAVWLMLPAAVVDQVIGELAGRLEAGDIIIDGGNSWYKDDIVRARQLDGQGIHYIDAGTSGGVWGLERGYCLMLGGEPETVRQLEPLFAALAPGMGDIPRTRGRSGDPSPAEQGYLHCGPAGAGHFVKMVHNGIEYGDMQLIAEAYDVLRRLGRLEAPQLADTFAAWNEGELSSFLIEITADIFRKIDGLTGHPLVEVILDSAGQKGTGKWTGINALELGQPLLLFDLPRMWRESGYCRNVHVGVGD